MLILTYDQDGGIDGGFGKLIKTLYDFSVGKLPVGGTKEGCSGGFKLEGCVGIVPGLLIEVVTPGFTDSYTFFLVCEGGASAFRDIIFSPLIITRPNVLLICF